MRGSREINPASIDPAGPPRLRLLGGAVLRRGGTAVSGPAAQRHPLALLALLVTAPGLSLSREKLVAYLWPDCSERTARNRLTTCVHNVRNGLGEALLASAGADICLNLAAIECDVVEFQQAIAAGDPGRAAAAYQGHFLDGFHLPGSAEFDDWADRERDRLRRAWQATAEQLAAAAEARGDATVAIRWWRELSADDPYDSRTTMRLMGALDAAGSAGAALRVARTHADLLRDEFAGEPASEVLALAERIRSRSASPAAVARPPRRVAVLPFEIVGGEEMPGFTDGVHGDLLNRLSSIADVSVISRTSVMRYRGSSTPIEGIARELGADWVVQGGVQAANGQVRVDARLVDAREDRQIWGEAYRSALAATELFEVQAQIAGQIAVALEARLSPAERRAVAQRPTTDLTSHLLCVQGRGHLDERTEAGLRQGAAYFEGAIRRDPDNALAWSGLADALALLGFYGFSLPASAPPAMEAARRAVALDPESGEAHASVGILHSLQEDGAAACRALERALVLRPSHAEAHVWLGWVLLLRGRASEALPSMRRGVEIDPLAPAYRVYLAETWLANGEPDRALLEARRAGEIQPGYGLAHFIRGLVLHHLGRFGEAAEALEHALTLVPLEGTPTHLEVHALLGVVRAAQGNTGAAREALARIEAAPPSVADPFSAGLVHAALGDTDAAFAALGSVQQWKAFAVEYARYFFPTELGPLRPDPRYRQLLETVDSIWGEEREPA